MSSEQKIVEYYQKLVSDQQEMINFLVNQNSKFDRIIRMLQTLIKSHSGSRKQITDIKNMLITIENDKNAEVTFSQILPESLIEDPLFQIDSEIHQNSFHPDYDESTLENSNQDI